MVRVRRRRRRHARRGRRPHPRRARRRRRGGRPCADFRALPRCPHRARPPPPPPPPTRHGTSPSTHVAAPRLARRATADPQSRPAADAATFRLASGTTTAATGQLNAGSDRLQVQEANSGGREQRAPVLSSSRHGTHEGKQKLSPTVGPSSSPWYPKLHSFFHVERQRSGRGLEAAAWCGPSIFLWIRREPCFIE
ncbi:unnamed protein product [Urochloa humidicola]